MTVKAGEDDDAANDTVTLTHSATSTDTGYQGIMIASVAVTVTDNDTPLSTDAGWRQPGGERRNPCGDVVVEDIQPSA